MTAPSDGPDVRPARDRDADGRPEQRRPRDRTGRPQPYGTVLEAYAEEFEYATVEEALAGGHRLWDERRFFEAHEALEHVWHAAPEEDRRFWQGVIQVAVAAVHHQRDNPRGVAAMLAKVLDKLGEYPPTHHGIDVAELRTRAGAVRERALAAGTDGDLDPGTLLDPLPVEDAGPWFARGDDPHPLPDEEPWRSRPRRADTDRERDRA